MKTVTQWFSPNKSPTRAGVYQTQQPDGKCFFNEWNGVEWSYGNYACVPPRSWQPLPKRLLARWRGLAEEPK